MATGKAKAGTLKTRERTLENKSTPSGNKRRISAAAEPAQEETDLAGEEVEELAPIGGNEDDGEPLDASQAEEGEPVDPEPEPAAAAPAGRRGRPKGSRKPKAEAAPAEAPAPRDLFAELCEAGFTIKRLAASHGCSTEQILTAVGQIVGAVTDVESAAYVEPSE